jgi:hypothetical protein
LGIDRKNRVLQAAFSSVLAHALALSLLVCCMKRVQGCLALRRLGCLKPGVERQHR